MASAFFQCPVAAEHSDAVLVIRGRRIDVNVAEQSIDGFAVTAPATARRSIALSAKWHLIYDGIDHQVHLEWMFHPIDGVIQLGLRRVDETQLDNREGSVWLSGLRSVWESFCRSCSGGSEMLFGGAIFVLVFLLVLSPVGEALGTKDLAASFTDALLSLGRLFR